eukprot:TRINITY_DN5356_c0_g1_i10.p1 TRINITY_DN5356_c0_g1~~TRINITY_DN5356_c0_g1_i10.p1  ORF type:complete len:203 (-),score=60.24 TRINITY_DN5356_c0_g1_i10:76-684(-)
MEELRQRHRKNADSSKPSIKLSMSVKRNMEEGKEAKNKLNTLQTQPEPTAAPTNKTITRSENKEIVEHLLSELAAIESKVGGSARSSFTNGGQQQDKGRHYKELVSKTAQFKTGKGKSEYLLKELESAMGKIDTLESNIRALKRENESWSNLLKASSNNRTNIGNEKLKDEIKYLKSIISSQHLKLETFKKEVIEKFCRSKY